MPAIPIVAAAAGAYSAINGADNQRRALHAQQDQANAALNSQQQGAAQAQNANLQAYFNSDPTFLAEYNRNRAATGDTRSPTQWLADGLASNPGDDAKFQAFSSSNPSGVIPSSAMGPGGMIDVNILQQQARAVASQNAANSAALEQQYNPGAAALRSGSLSALLGQSGQSTSADLQALLAGRIAAGSPAAASVQAATAAPASFQTTDVAPQSYSTTGVTARTAQSALLNDAIAKAQSDLALGGQLPQDVRNLVARNAASRAALTAGNLGLGRDITARDLGLTSLDLEQRRLTAAQSLGQSQLGANQFNAQLGQGADQFNVGAENTAALNNAQFAQAAAQFNAGSRNTAAQTNAQLAQQIALANMAAQNQAASQNASLQQQAAQFGQNNFLNQAQLLQALSTGDWQRALATAQFGQSITPPASGLDPGSVANIAIGNSNLANNAQQNANAAAAAAGQQKTQLGGQLLGAGLGFAQQYFNSQPTTAAASPSSYSTPGYFQVSGGVGNS